MKFSQYFELEGLTQNDLDFLDGLIDKDVPLYIDPSQIEVQEGDWFQESSAIINSFFERIFTLYRNGDKAGAEALLINAHEPNETKLGVSRGFSQGRGTSTEKLIEVFNHITDQGLLAEELITDYTDLNIFVKDFAEDRMSDLVTNLLREKLAEYTIKQSGIYGLELTSEPIDIGVAWDVGNSNWKQVHTKALIAENKLLLLVPKSIVVQKYLYSVEEYLTKSVYVWRKQYHLDNDTSLVRKKFVKKYDRLVSFPPKNETIIKNEITDEGLTHKEYAIKSTLANRGLISDFRDTINHTLRGTNNNRLSDEALTQIVNKRESE